MLHNITSMEGGGGMKIEFVKQETIDGTYYQTQINGSLVIGSTKMDKDKAEEIYNRIVECNGRINQVQILKSIDV